MYAFQNTNETGQEQPGDENDIEPNEEENEEEFESEIEDNNVETYTAEQGFDFKGLVVRFANKNVCMAYSIMLKNYRRNSDFTNHCVIKMLHRIAFDCTMPALLFQFSYLRIFQKINLDYQLSPKNKALLEMQTFAKHVLRKFFEVAKNNKKVFMEMCFWQTTKDAFEIVEGYETSGGLTRKQKASFWSEEDEEKLVRVFHQFQEMKEKGEDVDVIDGIETFFEESNKTRRQIMKKLKQLELIKVKCQLFF